MSVIIDGTTGVSVPDGGTGTQAVNANGVATAFTTLPAAQNAIINGRMWNAPDSITSWTNPASGTYLLGLWYFGRMGIGNQINAAQVTTGPTDCPSALQFTCTTAQAVLGSGDLVAVDQVIEASNCAQYIGNTFTLRGSIKSDVSGTVPVVLRNNTGTHSYVFPVTVAAGVETAFEHTLVGGLTAAASWGTGTGAGLRLGFCLAAGATYHAPTPAVWAAGNYLGLAGQLNAVGVVGLKLALTNVSMVLGTAKPMAEDFALDSRRMERFFKGSLRAYFGGQAVASTTFIDTALFSPMRATPSVTVLFAAVGGAAGVPYVLLVGPNHISFGALGTASAAFVGDISVHLSARY